jgi:hypothetical protein
MHAYFGVDLGLVWRVVDRALQALETAVAAIIGDVWELRSVPRVGVTSGAISIT